MLLLFVCISILCPTSLAVAVTKPSIEINFTDEVAIPYDGYDGVMFPYDFCNILCLTRVHTLCVRIIFLIHFTLI